MAPDSKRVMLVFGSMIAARPETQISFGLNGERLSGKHAWHSAIRIDISERRLLKVIMFDLAGLVGKAEFFKDDQDFGRVGYTVYESVRGANRCNEKSLTCPEDSDRLHCILEV